MHTVRRTLSFVFGGALLTLMACEQAATPLEPSTSNTPPATGLGSYVTKAQERKRSELENYTNQVQAANRMIHRLIEGILRDSPAPPVIMVQGDEGPYPPGTGRDTFAWRTANRTQLLQKTGILNAYYLPGADPRVLYPRISPVNSFRVVFNTYFGTSLPLLPDRTLRHVSDQQPFMFDDITAQLTAVAQPAVTAE